MSEVNPAVQPCPPEDFHKDGRWMSVHERFVSECHDREPEVVFLGDSILSHFLYTRMWTDMFAPLHCLNFGISGDQTQHLLWRIEHGELDNVKPKTVVSALSDRTLNDDMISEQVSVLSRAVVLLIGTNNIFHTSEQVAEGILTIVKRVHEKLPESNILVLSLLPRGQKPNRLREKNNETNRLVAGMITSVANAQFIDITGGFVQPDGTISHRDMYDYLHLTVEGYIKAFTLVHEHLISLFSADKDDVTSLKAE